MDLIEFVQYHTMRGECTCGKCVDVKNEAPMPALFGAHTVDMEFFKVAFLNAPAKDEFLRLMKDHKGVHNEVDCLDGKEHNYLELGGWIGDQGLAMQFMALGVHLGVFSLLGPSTVFSFLPKEMRQQLAGQGFVAIQAYAGRVMTAEEQAKADADEESESLGESISTICSTAAQDFEWDDEKMVHVLIDFCDNLVREGKITAQDFHDHVMTESEDG